MQRRARAFLRRAFAPSWATWTAATVLALAVTWATWRTWRTPVDGGQWVVEHHAYWPFYEWSHSDFVRGPVAAALTWNYLAGLALCWPPAALTVETVRVAGERAAAAVDASSAVGRVERIGQRGRERVGMRSRLFWTTVAFALVGSLVPHPAISLYTLPGTLLRPSVVTVLPVDQYADVTHALRPALAFPVWYAILAGVAALTARYDVSRALFPDVDVRLGGGRRGRR